jgi:hypothetical protein
LGRKFYLKVLDFGKISLGNEKKISAETKKQDSIASIYRTLQSFVIIQPNLGKMLKNE